MRNYHAHFEHEKYYHIYNRGNNSEKIFLNDGNFHFFLSKWIKYIDPYAETLAYCLMPNHFHFLIKIRRATGISDEESNINLLMESRFKNLFSSYALAFNNQQKRHGSLFEKRFNRILIDSDHYLSKIIHYIHNNPIHHGLASDYRKWKFSSYRSILSDKPTRVKREEVLKWYGDKKGFINYHNLNICYKEIKDVSLDLIEQV